MQQDAATWLHPDQLLGSLDERQTAAQHLRTGWRQRRRKMQELGKGMRGMLQWTGGRSALYTIASRLTHHHTQLLEVFLNAHRSRLWMATRFGNCSCCTAQYTPDNLPASGAKLRSACADLKTQTPMCCSVCFTVGTMADAIAVSCPSWPSPFHFGCSSGGRRKICVTCHSQSSSSSSSVADAAAAAAAACCCLLLPAVLPHF